jgi:hypothetical protein
MAIIPEVADSNPTFSTKAKNTPCFEAELSRQGVTFLKIIYKG